MSGHENNGRRDSFAEIEPSKPHKPEPQVHAFEPIQTRQRSNAIAEPKIVTRARSNAIDDPVIAPRQRSNAIDDSTVVTRARSNAIDDPVIETRQRSNAFAVTEQDKAEVDHSLGIKWNHRNSTVEQFNKLNDGSRRLSTMVNAMKDTKAYKLEKSYQDKIDKANKGSFLKRPFRKLGAWISKKWHGTDDKTGKLVEATKSAAVGALTPPGVNELRIANNIENTYASEKMDIRMANSQLGDKKFISKGWDRGVEFNRKSDHIKNAVSLGTQAVSLGVIDKVPGLKSGILAAGSKAAKAIHERGDKLKDVVLQDRRHENGMIKQDSVAKESYQYAALNKKQKMDALQTVNRSEQVSKQTAQSAIEKR